VCIRRSCACALSDFVPSLKTSHANWTEKLHSAEQEKHSRNKSEVQESLPELRPRHDLVDKALAFYLSYAQIRFHLVPIGISLAH